MIQKKYNVILVYDYKQENILMCKRTKEPFKDYFCLVGGKIEDGEDGFDAAYRELEEETGIKKKDISLKNIVNWEYPLLGEYIQVYAGHLNKDVILIREVDELCWINHNENFFDTTKYAGQGNIGHVIEHVKSRREELF